MTRVLTPKEMDEFMKGYSVPCNQAMRDYELMLDELGMTSEEYLVYRESIDRPRGFALELSRSAEKQRERLLGEVLDRL